MDRIINQTELGSHIDTDIRIQTQTQNIGEGCMCMCMCTYMYVHACGGVYICAREYVWIHTHICVNVCTCMCIHTYIVRDSERQRSEGSQTGVK